MMIQGCLMALTGEAVGRCSHDHLWDLAACRSTGATLFMPWYLSTLAVAYAELGQFDDAWRSISEAMTVVETTKETVVGGGD